jgi:hypothetical protein
MWRECLFCYFLPVLYIEPFTQEGIEPTNSSLTGVSVAGTFLKPTGEGAGSSTLALGFLSAGVIIVII